MDDRPSDRRTPRPPTVIDLRDPGPLGLPHPIAFVLSGGASAAAVQVGMLRALDQAGVVPDLVLGTSAGAVNGAVLAARPHDAWLRLTAIWRTLRRTDVFGPTMWRRLRLVARSRQHLYDSSALADLVGRHLPADRLEDLVVPFGAVVTDATTGFAHTLTEGDLAAALLASCAIPGVFPSVEIDGTWYWDGGLAANVPVRQAVDEGAASVVVLDSAAVTADEWSPSTLTRTVHHAVGMLIRRQFRADVAVAAEVPVLYVANPLGSRIGPFDFEHTSELLDVGYRHACDLLTDLAVDGPGLYGDRPRARPERLTRPLAPTPPM